MLALGTLLFVLFSWSNFFNNYWLQFYGILWMILLFVPLQFQNFISITFFGLGGSISGLDLVAVVSIIPAAKAIRLISSEFSALQIVGLLLLSSTSFVANVTSVNYWSHILLWETSLIVGFSITEKRFRIFVSYILKPAIVFQSILALIFFTNGIIPYATIISTDYRASYAITATDQSLRIQGTLGHPIIFGVMMGLLIIILIIEKIHIHRLAGISRFHNKYFILLILISGFCLLRSYSRTGLLATAVTLVSLILFLNLKHKIILTLALIFTAILYTNSTYFSYISGVSATISVQQRIEAFFAFRDIIFMKEFLFSRGYGTAISNITDYRFLESLPNNLIDNSWLTWSLEIGTLFALTFLIFWIKSIFARQNFPNPIPRFTLIFMFICSWTFDFQYWPVFTTLFFFSLGIVNQRRIKSGQS